MNKGLLDMFLGNSKSGEEAIKTAVDRNLEAKRTLLHKAHRAELTFDELARCLREKRLHP